jgi:hypothetical protein
MTARQFRAWTAWRNAEPTREEAFLMQIAQRVFQAAGVPCSIESQNLFRQRRESKAEYSERAAVAGIQRAGGAVRVNYRGRLITMDEFMRLRDEEEAAAKSKRDSADAEQE